MGKTLIKCFLIFFVILIDLSCENLGSPSNLPIKKKCDNPSWRDFTIPVTENIFMKGFSLSDQSISSEKYYRHYTDKHGTKWKEEKTGLWRMVYDIELKILKVYKNKKLIKKHRNVTAEAKGIETLYEALCIYHDRKFFSCEYISGGNVILIMSEGDFSYVPNKSVEYSSSSFFRNFITKVE
jgi:hypothetical protein